MRIPLNGYYRLSLSFLRIQWTHVKQLYFFSQLQILFLNTVRLFLFIWNEGGKWKQMWGHPNFCLSFLTPQRSNRSTFQLSTEPEVIFWVPSPKKTLYSLLKEAELNHSPGWWVLDQKTERRKLETDRISKWRHFFLRKVNWQFYTHLKHNTNT